MVRNTYIHLYTTQASVSTVYTTTKPRAPETNLHPDSVANVATLSPSGLEGIEGGGEGVGMRISGSFITTKLARVSDMTEKEGQATYF